MESTHLLALMPWALYLKDEDKEGAGGTLRISVQPGALGYVWKKSEPLQLATCKESRSKNSASF